MKLIFVIILHLVYFVHSRPQQPLTNEQLGRYSNSEQQCVVELRTDQRMIDSALKQLYMPEDNPQFNDFMECTWKKDGFIDVDGNIILSRFQFYVQDAYMDAVGIRDLAQAFAMDTVNYCKAVRGSTPGQTGVKMMNCILKRLYD